MSSRRLAEEEIRERLSNLPGWTLRENKLHREFQFSDFVSAFGFMSSMALVSESMNHHPEWFNVYKTVRIDLSTHDVGGVSSLDFEWAEAANSRFLA